MRGERLNNGLSVAAAGDGPPLVFLPGLGRGADLSEEVPRSLARSARAVALGSGRTVHLICRPVGMPSGTTIAELAGWHAIALRERFGQPVDVMGVSGGGITALQLAIDHREVLHRLVVCVAASRVSDRGRRDLLYSVERERRAKSSAWVSSGDGARYRVRLGHVEVPVREPSAVQPDQRRPPGSPVPVPPDRNPSVPPRHPLPGHTRTVKVPGRAVSVAPGYRNALSAATRVTA
ncbi:hypothetical protein AB0M46_28105 [Dactylosporangium sp. NPDC051485]|uniref:alpha/beta fold hydrolase n=1 Tax=Dactylosporangium sp. NPDC051485 TaxID=3154846 RepID=UPI0034338E13